MFWQSDGIPGAGGIPRRPADRAGPTTGLRWSSSDSCYRRRRRGLASFPCIRRQAAALAAVLWALPAAVPLHAWGRKVEIRRKFSPGAAVVYRTHTETQSRVETDPKGLEAFLPPIPSDLVTDQENAMTVLSVHQDGGAEMESRFDRFDIKSQLPANLTEANRNALLANEEEFAQSLRGRPLSLRYDRRGRLMDIQGTDEMLQQVSAPFREPLLQVFRYLLEQIGGNGLYPDHAVSPGEEWQRKLEFTPSDSLPFNAEGTSAMRFAGKARASGVKAAVIEYRFTDVLAPRLDKLGAIAPLAALEAQGLKLDIRMEGEGQGRALLALDDGRMLENHATLRQVLTAHLKPARPTARPADPITLKLTTDTTLEVIGTEGKQ